MSNLNKNYGTVKNFGECKIEASLKKRSVVELFNDGISSFYDKFDCMKLPFFIKRFAHIGQPSM
jgi:hypothetical protein